MPDMKQQNVAECLNTLFNANLVEDIMKNGKKGKYHYFHCLHYISVHFAAFALILFTEPFSLSFIFQKSK